MTSARLSRALVGAAFTGLLAATAACASDDASSRAEPPSSAPAASSATATTAPATSAAPVPTGPFGPGCGGFPAEGPGSFAAIAGVPVGIAVSRNPVLTDLTQAIVAANLVDVVNTREDVTVLAPVNAAFQALDPAALTELVNDVPRLTTVLTHHVIPGRLAPDQVVGEHTTLNGDTVTVAGSGEDLTVAAADQTLAGAAPATVLCGNVQTANATVYVIDQVLSPAAG